MWSRQSKEGNHDNKEIEWAIDRRSQSHHLEIRGRSKGLSKIVRGNCNKTGRSEAEEDWSHSQKDSYHQELRYYPEEAWRRFDKQSDTRKQSNHQQQSIPNRCLRRCKRKEKAQELHRELSKGQEKRTSAQPLQGTNWTMRTAFQTTARSHWLWDCLRGDWKVFARIWTKFQQLSLHQREIRTFRRTEAEECRVEQVEGGSLAELTILHDKQISMLTAKYTGKIRRSEGTEASSQRKDRKKLRPVCHVEALHKWSCQQDSLVDLETEVRNRPIHWLRHSDNKIKPPRVPRWNPRS